MNENLFTFAFLFSFMDKIFVLSSKDSLKEFQKNPRRYVTQLRSPCKLFLYGPRLSGVEQLAQDLAKKYGATVRLNFVLIFDFNDIFSSSSEGH